MTWSRPLLAMALASCASVERKPGDMLPDEVYVEVSYSDGEIDQSGEWNDFNADTDAWRVAFGNVWHLNPPAPVVRVAAHASAAVLEPYAAGPDGGIAAVQTTSGGGAVEPPPTFDPPDEEPGEEGSALLDPRLSALIGAAFGAAALRWAHLLGPVFLSLLRLLGKLRKGGAARKP